MIKVWKLLSVVIVAAVCLGLLLVPGAPLSNNVASASGGVYIEIQPETTAVVPNGSFNVSVWVQNPDGNEIYGVQARLNFDSSYFNVTSIDNGPILTELVQSLWDNSTATVDHDCNMPTPPGTPTTATSILVATIHCQALAKEGISTIDFVYQGAPPYRQTMVVDGGADYLEGGNMSLMHSGTVVIGPAFNLTVTSTGCCPIDVSGAVSGTVAAGSTKLFVVPVGSVTLAADESDVCCVFDNWTGNVSTPNNPTTVTGDEGENLTANATCSVPQYNLTMNVTGNGTTTPSGTNTYDCGYNVSITATANASWRFVNWTTTGDITKIDDPTANSTTVTMDENKTVTANFVERFTLTMAVTNNGTTDPVEGDHDYDNGTVVNLTAIPDACWDFVNWTGDVADPNSTSTNVTVDANKTVTANFAQVNYTLNITSTAGGVTEPAEGDHSYINCTVVNLTATPDAGYAFVGWSGDVSTIADVNSSATNITMTGSYSIIAHFGPHDFSASPISLTFTTDEGVNPPAQTLEVCNTGSGILNWSLSDGGTAWLSETPTSGSLAEEGCEDVTVSVNVAGMEAGDYTATITITGSPVQEVPVSLHIESVMIEIPGGPAGLSASALSISPQQVQPGQDVTISISVANTGGATGSYNAVLYINSVVEDSQSVSVAAGASKNVIFTVSKSQAGVYDVSLAGQSGQFEVVSTGWFGGGLGTGGIIAIVVVVIILIVAVVFILRGTRREV